MKKNGFTLAEVLITLTIIGIVAALAAPALNNSVQKSKVGPSLRKFISTMEEANRHLMADNDSNTIYDIVTTPQEYLTQMEKYISGASANKTLSELEIKPANYTGGTNNAPYNMDKLYIYNLNNGDSFAVGITENAADVLAAKATAKGSYKGGVGALYYDLNGFDQKPNRLGKDIFHFQLDNNGAVIPDGGKTIYNAYTGRETEMVWKNSSWNQCNEKKVTYGHSCAGSVADNNWKVIYKY